MEHKTCSTISGQASKEEIHLLHDSWSSRVPALQGLQLATAELETGCAGSSKNLHLDQDPLCRAIEEYRDVLTKNYMI
ncbi:hypothetical protein Nmel_005615 [Mimus melanotis]